MSSASSSSVTSDDAEDTLRWRLGGRPRGLAGGLLAIVAGHLVAAFMVGMLPFDDLLVDDLAVGEGGEECRRFVQVAFVN